jgi:hypothetical protein
MCFGFHFDHPNIMWGTVALIFCLTVGVFGALAQLTRVRQAKETEEEHNPMWYNFLTATCLLAVVAGVLFGSTTYAGMDEYYRYDHLNTYHNIDPAMYVGEQLVDAGRVMFKDDVYVDVTHSMGFKNKEMYCVAPIVSPKMSADAKSYYDFWAVGKGCCSGVQPDFHCKGYSDMINMGGLRLMTDAERPFYRLAVQQAEATYKIATHKPLFFTWEFDPVAYTNNLYANGIRSFYYGICTALAFLVFATIAATLVVARELPNRGPMEHGHGKHELHL